MIVVTGGAGFIGSCIVAGLEAAARGPLVVVDRFDHDSKRANLAKRRAVEVVAPEALDRLLEDRAGDVRHVVHMGAISSTLETDVEALTETNVHLPQRIWRWCVEHEVPLTYASSAATYGDGSAGFDDDGTSAALARLEPLNAYARSKHAFDLWVAEAIERGEEAPPRWAGLKFFNVYGPNEYHKGEMRSLVAKSYSRAATGEPVTLFRSHHPDYPDGGQRRDFVYVKDCVDVVLWLVEGPGATGLFNVGTGRAQTWLELVGALYAATGHELRVDFVDIPEAIRDRYQYFTEARMTRLRDAGYTLPFRPVEEGVADYVKAHLATTDPYL